MKNARKMPIFAICMFILFSSMCLKPECAEAAQDISNMSASVGVNAVFGITVFPLSLEFPSTDPGTTTDGRELMVSCSSNNNQPWSAQLSNIAELTSGAYTIPNGNFNWIGYSEGIGQWNAGTGTLSTTPFTFYNAHANEYITASPVILHLTFNVDVPANQVAGSYASTLIITITE